MALLITSKTTANIEDNGFRHLAIIMKNMNYTEDIVDITQSNKLLFIFSAGDARE